MLPAATRAGGAGRCIVLGEVAPPSAREVFRHSGHLSLEELQRQLTTLPEGLGSGKGPRFERVAPPASASRGRTQRGQTRGRSHWQLYSRALSRLAVGGLDVGSGIGGPQYGHDMGSGKCPFGILSESERSEPQPFGQVPQSPSVGCAVRLDAGPGRAPDRGR